MTNANRNPFGFLGHLWLTLGMFAVFVATFVIYVRAEKQIDHANELRQQSFLLAEELHQSSDDLTRMVRAYVVTGDPIFKQHYQEVLDIRDGKSPRPTDYHLYWDLVLNDEKRPAPSGQATPLLDLMRHTGFTETELAKLTEAKARSDALTRTEYAAMALIESSTPPSAANRDKAIQMLFGPAYHKAKADIMQPIHEFYRMSDQRTLQSVQAAASHADRVRSVLAFFGLLLVLLLWNARRSLRAILGCSSDELYARIAGLGRGDVSTPILVAKGMENTVLGWLSATQTNLSRTQSLLRTSESRYRFLTEKMKDVVWSLDIDTMRFTYISPSAQRLRGYTAEEIMAQPMDASLTPEGLKQVRAFIAEHSAQFRAGELSSDVYFTHELEQPCKDGSTVWTEVVSHYVRNEATGHVEILGVTRDISERKVAETILRDSKIFVQSTLDSIPDEIAVLDNAGVIVAVNESWRRFSRENSPGPRKLAPHSDVGTNYLEVCRSSTAVESDGSMDAHDGIRAVLDARLPCFNLEYSCHSPNQQRWFNMTVNPLGSGQNGVVIAHHNITERKLAEDKIRNLAFYDSLTQLPNRRLLYERLLHAMASSRRSANYCALMVLDLDNFKPLNDMHGHAAGDLLLVEVANRLTSCVREIDTVARFGGDEFVIVLSDLGGNKDAAKAQLSIIAEKIRTTLAEPYSLSIQQQGEKESVVTHHCTASIGGTLFIGHEVGQDEFFKQADAAMYQAKNAGRNQFRFYD